ncbi:response regulator [Silvibacterium acidisoli]|uniref:response regulator n=1 Tax=Acidobacteriaceae bacterium ZG23-2 TaxID=2883246 RepID=UPI00406CED3E
MTTEQNSPQAPQPEGQAAQGQNQGQRRRRRRRKGGKGTQNGQAPQATQQGNGGQQNQGQQGQKNKPSSQNRFLHKGGSGGQQQGGGGGGRRKSKPRKQQVFVGPMDHSYRVSNGNVADAPPSTIELRNGNLHHGSHHGHSNGNGNGNLHDSHLSIEPPAAIREDAPTRIYCFIEDLFFLAKIQETARKLGVKVAFVKADKDIVSKLSGDENGPPSLIVFDLNNANAKPLTLIPKIRTKLKKGTSIIGFLSHLQGDLKVKATEAGCDMVMPRSAFSQNLPNLLRRHGIEEEPEFEPQPVF